MRSMIALVGFAAVTLIVLVTYTSGQETQSIKKSTTEIAREGAQQRRAQTPFAKGTLQAHDFLRRTLTLKTKDGPRTFTYTVRTYIFRGKEKITPDKLKTGEIIALRFYTEKDGRILVQRMKVYEPVQSAGAESPTTTETAK